MKRSVLINTVAAATLFLGTVAVAQAQGKYDSPQTVCQQKHCPGEKHPGQQMKSGAMRDLHRAPRIEATAPQTPVAVQEGNQPAQLKKKLSPKAGHIQVQNPTVAERRARHKLPANGEGASGQMASTRARDHVQVAAAPKNEPATTGSVNAKFDLNRSQRRDFRRFVREEHFRRIPRLDFALNVGVTVPRTIELHRLPRRIVELVPVYDGYEFFELANGEIIIVDPATLQIVSVIYA
jgi:hypothetical protein